MFKAAAALCLLLASQGYCALNRTYPSSATSNIRYEAYVDSFSTIYSTWSINLSTWTYIDYKLTYISTQPVVNGSVKDYTGNISTMSWTFNEFIDVIMQNTKVAVILDVADHDVEQYMVFPATTAPEGWLGWCISYNVFGKIVPKECPKP